MTKAGAKLDIFIAENLMGFSTPSKGWFYEFPHTVAEQRGDDYLRPVDFLSKYSTDDSLVVSLLKKLMEVTGSCVLLEASRNPKEFLCTIGWHHRGNWFKDLQVSAETAPLAVCLAAKKWLRSKKEKCPKP